MEDISTEDEAQEAARKKDKLAYVKRKLEEAGLHNVLPDASPGTQLPTRELTAILAAAAMCVGKDPKYVQAIIPEIREVALELADALVE